MRLVLGFLGSAPIGLGWADPSPPLIMEDHRAMLLAYDGPLRLLSPGGRPFGQPAPEVPYRLSFIDTLSFTSS